MLKGSENEKIKDKCTIRDAKEWKWRKKDNRTIRDTEEWKWGKKVITLQLETRKSVNGEKRVKNENWKSEKLKKKV